MGTDQTDNIPAECREDADSLIRELGRETTRLNRMSLRGVLALALFIVVSALAWRGFPFLPSPDTVTAVLGAPPSSRMISVALLIYTFSAIVLSLARMASGIEHRSSFGHVGFLAGFFLFYFFGKSLDDNFWAVFGAGITVLGVESYRIWSYCSDGVNRCRQDLEFVNRTGRRPPQD